MDHGEPTRILDRLDLPGHPRRSLALDLRAPAGGEALHEAAWRVDLEVLAVHQRLRAGRVHTAVARSDLPVALHPDAEVVPAPQLAVGDRLPQALRRRL